MLPKFIPPLRTVQNEPLKGEPQNPSAQLTLIFNL
jgi:hypothetical protein